MAQVMRRVMKQDGLKRAQAYLVVWVDPHIDEDDRVWKPLERKPEDRAINYMMGWVLGRGKKNITVHGNLGTWEHEPGKIVDTALRLVIPQACILAMHKIDVTPQMLNYRG